MSRHESATSNMTKKGMRGQWSKLSSLLPHVEHLLGRRRCFLMQLPGDESAGNVMRLALSIFKGAAPGYCRKSQISPYLSAIRATTPILIAASTCWTNQNLLRWPCSTSLISQLSQCLSRPEIRIDDGPAKNRLEKISSRLGDLEFTSTNLTTLHQHGYW